MQSVDSYSFLVGVACAAAAVPLFVPLYLKYTKASNLSTEVDYDSDEDDSGEYGEEYKMVFVVRTDLKMGKGKIAAQCGHATLGSFQHAQRNYPQNIKAWNVRGKAKVAVKTSGEAELVAVAAACEDANLPHYLVMDAGRTQIAAGSLTVCGIGPAPVSAIDAVTGSFKLL